MQRTYHSSEFGQTHAEGEIFAALVAAGRRQRFASGMEVLRQGDPGNGFWLIEGGHVMACRYGREGERTVFAVLGAGDLVGELACFAGGTQQVYAIAEGEASLVWIDVAQVGRLLAADPRFAWWLLGTLASKLRSALDRVEGDHNLPAPARVARVLADMAAHGASRIDMTQQQLADFVGVSRITIGKVLAKLEAEGLIERAYGSIRVRAAQRLAAYSE